MLSVVPTLVCPQVPFSRQSAVPATRDLDDMSQPRVLSLSHLALKKKVFGDSQGRGQVENKKKTMLGHWYS